MLKHSKIKSSLPKKVERDLDKIMRIADARKKYRWAINIYERRRREYELPDRVVYNLGLLYDHLAIFKSMKVNAKRPIQKRRARQYLTEAIKYYRQIRRRNPRYAPALFGLRRAYETLGQYSRAIRYARKQINLDPKMQTALGVTYQLMGNNKKAEEWYLHDLNILGKSNIVANANLMMFYNDTGQYAKAIPFARKTASRIHKYFREGEHNLTAKHIMKHIRVTANKAGPLWRGPAVAPATDRSRARHSRRLRTSQ